MARINFHSLIKGNNMEFKYNVQTLEQKKVIENIIYNRLKFMSDEPYPLVSFPTPSAFEIVVKNLTENLLKGLKQCTI